MSVVLSWRMAAKKPAAKSARRATVPGTIGHRMREVRGTISLRELESATGISRGRLSEIEGGATRDPGVETVAAIAAALGVRFEWLALGHGARHEKK